MPEFAAVLSQLLACRTAEDAGGGKLVMVREARPTLTATASPGDPWGDLHCRLADCAACAFTVAEELGLPVRVGVDEAAHLVSTWSQLEATVLDLTGPGLGTGAPDAPPGELIEAAFLRRGSGCAGLVATGIHQGDLRVSLLQAEALAHIRVLSAALPDATYWLRATRPAGGRWGLVSARRGLPDWVATLAPDTQQPRRAARPGTCAHPTGDARRGGGGSACGHRQDPGAQPWVVDHRTEALDAALRRDPDLGQRPEQVQLTAELVANLRSLDELRGGLGAALEAPIRTWVSVKTNPNAGWLGLARTYGLQAECISMAEVDHVAGLGFDTAQVVLNGPGKWWPGPPKPGTEFGAIFADNHADLSRCVQMLQSGQVRTKVVGIRVRPEGIESRFGIDLAEGQAIARVADQLREGTQALGLHMNLAVSACGSRRWIAAARAVAEAGARLQEEIGRPLAIMDFGGGWRARGWDQARACLEAAGSACRATMAAVSQYWLEPGKSLTQTGFATVMRVLDIDEGPTRRAVLSGSFWDCPDLLLYPHTILWRGRGQAHWALLVPGRDHLMGRLCMETDLISRSVALPTPMRAGDHVAVLDTGGYDASLSREFGAGTSRW